MKNITSSLTWIVAALTTATAAQALDTVWVVRHADKVKAWEADDKYHPLSCRGLTRAERLAEKLADAEIAAIYTSDTARTLATGMPLAVAGVNAEIPIGPDPGTVTNPRKFFKKIKKTHARDEAVLVVGHSNTVPGLLISLGAEESCFGKLGLVGAGDDLEVEGFEGLWRVDLTTPGCDGMERQVVKLAY